MKIFAKNNDLNYGKDVKPLTAGNQKTAFDYVDKYKNQT